MSDDAAREQAWDAYFFEHQGPRDPDRGFDYRPFTAGYDAGREQAIREVVAWLRGDTRLYESFGWVADQLEHGALDAIAIVDAESKD